jgi:phenylpropionate dioxygenase-like ring-hydroxylating dioxygenase large terminal subunit
VSLTESYHDVVRRLLEFIDDRRTHYADDLLEMPVSYFRSVDQYRREIERIFSRVPLFVALSSDFPAPGSWRAFHAVETPVLLSRAGDGSLKAFLNVCRHRGVPVAAGHGEGARRFTCPFHAWSYDLDGALVGVPHPAAFEGLCREERGLVELPVAEKHGLVFIRLRPGEPIDADEHLAGLGPELGGFEFERYKRVDEPHMHRISANWKLVMDTFNEIYHFNHLHHDTGTNLMYGDVSTIDALGSHIRHCFAARSINMLRDEPQNRWQAILHAPYHYVFFPNVSATVVSVPETEFQPATNKLEFNQVFPVSATESITLHTAYTASDLDETARQRELEMIKYSCTAVLDNQDYWAAGQEQLTLGTGANRTLVYGRNERGCQLFNRSILAATGTTMDELEAWNTVTA